MRQEMVGDFAAPNIIYTNNNDDDLENSLFLFFVTDTHTRTGILHTYSFANADACVAGRVPHWRHSISAHIFNVFIKHS